MPADRIYYRDSEDGGEERVQTYSTFIERLRNEANVHVIEDDPVRVGNMTFFRYKLPLARYRMVDMSQREDIPDFAILDEKDQIRASVTGAWKGAYDCAVETYIHSAPYKVADLEKVRGKPMEETASTGANYEAFQVSLAANAITHGCVPIHDPEEHKTAGVRREDYSGAK